MKELQKMGLVPLTKKETVEENGGSNVEKTNITLGDILGPIILCCYNIPPIKL